MLVIVRHGNTFSPGEVPRRVGVRTDLPLAGSGQAQALRLGRHFAELGWRFDRISCSPLLRTRQTAKAIRAAFPDAPPCTPLELLAEVDHGPDEDRPEDQVIARIGRTALTAWDTQGVAPPDWIVGRDARLDGWRRLIAATGQDRHLLVTSNGAARFALLCQPDLGPNPGDDASSLPSLKLRTGAYGVIATEASGSRLLGWDIRP